MGCSDAHYKTNSKMGSATSLYSLYMDSILPMGVCPDDDAGVHITSTGTLRYDVYEGPFTYNDVFAVAPFANVFRYVPDVTATEIDTLTGKLNKGDKYRPDKADLASFVTSTYDDTEGRMYNLYMNDYDQHTIMKSLAKIRGVSENDIVIVPVRDDKTKDDFVDTTLVWKGGIQAKFPCSGEMN